MALRRFVLQRAAPLACARGMANDDDSAFELLLAKLKKQTPAEGAEVTCDPPPPAQRQTASITTQGSAQLNTPSRPRPPVAVDAALPVPTSVRLVNPFASMELPRRQLEDFTVVAKNPCIIALQEASVSAFRTLEAGKGGATTSDANGESVYTIEVLASCVHPLLAYLGAALDVIELQRHFVPFLEVGPLRRAAGMHSAKAGIFSFRNPFCDPLASTGVVMVSADDATFHQRILPSIHASWEPLEIVSRRLGFAANQVPRDAFATLLHTRSPFLEGAGGKRIVELGILERSNLHNKPLVATPLMDVSTISRNMVVVVRRTHAGAATALSVVEEVRLIGVAACSAAAVRRPPPLHRGNVGTESSLLGSEVTSLAMHLVGALENARQGDTDNSREIVRRATPLKQSVMVRVNEFSVPPRYLDVYHKHSPVNKHQRQQPSPSAQRPVAAASGNGSTGSISTPNLAQSSRQSAKTIHNTKVLIVTLKQRARLASGDERVRLLQQLGDARNELTALTGAAPASPVSVTTAAAITSTVTPATSALETSTTAVPTAPSQISSSHRSDKTQVASDGMDPVTTHTHTTGGASSSSSARRKKKRSHNSSRQ